MFRSLFLSLEFVRLSHSLINTVLLCVITYMRYRRAVMSLSEQQRMKLNASMEEQAKCAGQTSVGSPTVAPESSLK